MPLKNIKIKLIFLLKNGVYIDENVVLNSWKNPLNKLVKTANINLAKFIKNNQLVIGIASKRIYIFDMNYSSF